MVVKLIELIFEKAFHKVAERVIRISAAMKVTKLLTRFKN